MNNLSQALETLKRDITKRELELSNARKQFQTLQVDIMRRRQELSKTEKLSMDTQRTMTTIEEELRRNQGELLRLQSSLKIAMRKEGTGLSRAA